MSSRPTLHQGQLSWRLASDAVHAWVTQTGGMLGPVEFRVAGGTIRPYSVAPWAEESLPPRLPGILRALRGDFLCLPFGLDERPFRGERHPIHGECAHGCWRFRAQDRVGDRVTLRLAFRTRIRPGTIEKEVTLIDGHTAVYQRHTIAGMTGPMSYGHHAMLSFRPEFGAGRIAVSRFVFGQVWPTPFENPASGGYSSLLPGARFRSLQRVPQTDRRMADLSVYPAREGFEDAATLCSDPRLPIAWTTVTFPARRFLWFSLKHPRELGQTLFWFSNGGRHYPPWNGRHRKVLGLEEINAMPTGLSSSVAPNVFSRRGVPTIKQMDPEHPTVIRSIQGVAAIPAAFDVVKSMHRFGGGIEFRSKSGARVRVRLDHSFLA